MSALVPRSETIELLARLEEAGALTPRSLSLASRPDLTLEQFQAIGLFLDRLHDGTKFWVGDWILEGEARFSADIYQLASLLKRSERTLLNWSYTCSRVPRSRRRETLPYTQHALVAPLSLEEQLEWLDRSEREGWSSRQLQAALKARRELGEGERDECGDAVEEAARDLRTRLRVCGLDDTSILVEVSGVGFSYEVRIP